MDEVQAAGMAVTNQSAISNATPDLRLDLNKLRTNAPGSNRYSQRNKIVLPDDSGDDSSDMLEEDEQLDGGPNKLPPEVAGEAHHQPQQ